MIVQTLETSPHLFTLPPRRPTVTSNTTDTSLEEQALSKKLSAGEQEAGDLKEGLGRRDAEVAALKAEIARNGADTQAAAEKAEQAQNAIREEVAGLEARWR